MSSSDGANKLFAVLAVAAFVAIAAIAFFIGHRIGAKDERRARVKFHANLTAKLYGLADRGDTNRLKDKLAFLVYAYVSEHDKLVGTNQPAALGMIEARAIANRMRSNIVTFDPRHLDEFSTNGSTNRIPSPR